MVTTGPWWSYALPIAAVLAVLAVWLLLTALGRLVRLRLFASLVRLALAAVLIGVAGVLAGISYGTRGYTALVREELAATLDVRPTGPKRFEVTIALPDGRTRDVSLAGDEVVVEAHILKWTPSAAMLGLHTGFELDRIAGRYRDAAEEQSAPRTVVALGGEAPVDLFALRRKWAALAPLYDAEYGSGSFVPADRAARWEVRVSSTGLLIRPAPVQPGASSR